MKISKRSRYGIRMILELALHYGKEPLQISEIAQKEEISPKYLGQLIIPLKHAGYVSSIRGAYGGYVLAKPPEKITIKEIFTLLEGPVSLTECTTNPDICKRTAICCTRDIWKLISDRISGLLDTITLMDLVEDTKKKQSMIAFTYQI
ncbi:MAG: Rrf2 family transcriptional regulator [Spirochaetales bacterium]|nr:Rrf2 family transcriptional regulator [Spirochaetales bacterium]